MKDPLAVKDIYDKLPEANKALLDTQVDILCAKLKGCGPQTALEILVALGQFLAQADQPAEGRAK